MTTAGSNYGKKRVLVKHCGRMSTKVSLNRVGKEWKKNRLFPGCPQNRTASASWSQRLRKTDLENGNVATEEPEHEAGAQEVSRQPLLSLSASALQCVKLLEHQKWYEVSEEVQRSSCERAQSRFSSRREASTELKRCAAELEQHVATYLGKLQMKSGRDQAWLSSITTKGTSTDRIAASVLLIQQCPLAQTKNLQKLVQQAGRAGRREAYLAAEALKDLFLNDLLPPDRKLYFFEDHPLLAKRLAEIEENGRCGNSKRRKRAESARVLSHQDVAVTLSGRFSEAELLMLWLEDFIKSCYAQFVAILAAGSADTLPFYQQKCLKFAYELLVACPEQEKGHLTLLVSRLSSPIPKCAGTADYFLRQLLEVQKPMAPIVSQYVMQSVSEQLASDSLTAKSLGGLYRPVVFLSCIPCRRSDGELARHMAEIFLRIFRALVERFEASLDSGLQFQKLRRQRKTLKRKKRLKIKSANGAERGRAVSKEKEAGASDDALAAFNSRLLKAILKGLTHAVTSIPNRQLADLNVDTQLFARVLRRIDNSAVKIVFFSFLYKMAGLLQLDVRHLDSIFYASLWSFQLFDASNRCAILSCTADDGGIRPPQLIISLLRRLLQTVSHVNRSTLQIICLHRLGVILAKYSAWIAPLIALSAQALAEDEAYEEFQDVPLPELSQTTDAENSPLSPDGDSQIKENIGLEATITLPAGQYDPNGSRPDLARPDGSHLWELELQACSVVPNVAAFARDLRSWCLKRAESRLSKSVSPPSFSDYLPHVATPKDENTTVTDAWDPLSTTAVLDFLAYRPSNKVLKKKRHQTKALDEDDDPLFLESLNSPAYWKQKKHTFPHECFMKRYFTDGYVLRRTQNHDGSTQPEDADSDFEAVDMDLGGEEHGKVEDWMKHGDLSALDDDEDNAMDTFLDDILAAEADANGTEDDDALPYDDDVSEDEFEGVEQDTQNDDLKPLSGEGNDFNAGMSHEVPVYAGLDDSASAFGDGAELELHMDGSTADTKTKPAKVKKRGLKRRVHHAEQGSFADAEAFHAYLM